MKLTAVFLCATFLQVSARGFSQQVSLQFENAKIESVFSEIEKQSGFSFIYGKKLLSTANPVSVNIRNVSLNEALQSIFSKQPFAYKIENKYIIISFKKVEPNPIQIQSTPSTPVEVLPPIVRGKIRSEKGSPVAGVSIEIKGGKVIGMTDQNGDFSLRNIPDNAILVFSSVSMETLEVKLDGKVEMNITMKTLSSKLDEIVMIGYGTSSKRENTASISSITAEEIAKQPVQNPLNALQGRMAGALVTQANGLPGSRVTIQIRGVNSLDQTGTQPLYIIDGVPFNITDNIVPVTNDLNGRGTFAANGGLSPFALINPADIERIDILKDADATAIYGTRGANGVVLVTTKKGKAGKTKLDLNVYTGTGKVSHFIPMMNTQQYRDMRKSAYANEGITPNATTAPDLFLWDSTTTTDWQKKYMGGTASLFDGQATVSGGDTRNRFLLNTGYHKETPVFPGSYKSERISSRVNADHTSLDRKFNAAVSFSYSFDNTNLLARDLSSLYNLPPNLPVYNSDGSLYWNSNFTNPDSYLFVGYYGKTYNLMSNVQLKYSIIPGLDVKASIGYNAVHLDQNQQSPASSKSPLSSTPTNSATFYLVDQKSYIIEPQISYTKNVFGGKLNALLGGTIQNNLFNSSFNGGNNYSSASLLGSINGAGSISTPVSSYANYRYNSGFARLTYNYDSKYLLNAVLRRDGSTRFGPDHRFGNFWDIGAGWIFSNENFAKSIKFLSFGKLRASYGVTGNDQIQDYLYNSLYSSSGTYQNNAALIPSSIDNPTLHWQTTYKMEFGLDLAFLNRKVELTANYYRTRTPDQLGYLTLSSQAGFNSYISNFDALIQNTGGEFELTTRNIDTKSFTWTTSLNLTIPRTKLVDASKDYFYYNAGALGQPLSYQYRYIYMGADPATGKPMYRNFSKDSLTFTPSTTTDRAVIGYSAPAMYGGLNNVMDYKNFELSFFFQFTKQSANIYPSAAPGVLTNGNQTTYWSEGVWSKPGDIGALPKFTTNSSVYSSYAASSAVWGDASFLKLRTVNLAYTFSQQVLSRLKLTNARVYLQGQNLWWVSKNKYVFDPETGLAMPPLRVITAGLNLTF